MMKALVYTAPKSLEIRDVPMPKPEAGEVLIRVRACGICGSDMHAYLGHDERRPAPLILGHEVAGEIVDSNGTNWGEGTRVTVNPLVSCGECPACLEGRNNLCPNREIISMQPREGGMAEYLRMPVSNLVKIPDEVSFDKACLAEPLACGWHAVRLGIEKLDGAMDAVLVIGGGAIGLGTALALKAQGVKNITLCETNDLRIKTLKEIGINVVKPDEIEDQFFDMVIDGVGFAATRKLSCKVVRAGGIIMHVGLGDNADGLDVRRLTLQEIAFFGTYTYTPEDFRQTSAAIFSGELGPLDWMKPVKLEDGAAAFRDILSGEVSAPKIILNP